jgi:SAM-dependent methyltransferase
VSGSQERLESERRFHNRAFREQPRRRVSRFYAIKAAIDAELDRVLFAAPAGQSVLECGCGMGERLFELCRAGARCQGIDISDYAIGALRERATAAGLEIRYQVMNAESLAFPDHTFDLIYGSGILHHLDLDRALGSIARKLAPGGRAVFIEPLGHNRLINRFRSATPELRTTDEHPLRMEDFETARRHFGQVTVRSYFLSALALPVLFGQRVPAFLLACCNRLDRVAFAAIPWLRRQAWQALVLLEEPRC